MASLAEGRAGQIPIADSVYRPEAIQRAAAEFGGQGLRLLASVTGHYVTAAGSNPIEARRILGQFLTRVLELSVTRESR